MGSRVREEKRDQVDQERSHEPRGQEPKSPRGHVTKMTEYIALRSWENESPASGLERFRIGGRVVSARRNCRY